MISEERKNEIVNQVKKEIDVITKDIADPSKHIKNTCPDNMAVVSYVVSEEESKDVACRV